MAKKTKLKSKPEKAKPATTAVSQAQPETKGGRWDKLAKTLLKESQHVLEGLEGVVDKKDAARILTQTQ
jgi:hypothetical protein